MKKLNAYLLALALLIGMTQCKKEQPASGTTTDGGETVYITMKVDNGDRHIVYPGTGAVVYGEGDVIYVGNGGHYVGSLTYQNGTFSGAITNPSTADYLHFYFVGGQTPSVTPQAGSTTEFTVSIADQSTKLPVLSYGKSNTMYIDGNTAYTCMLENQCGLVKFTTQNIPGPITISGVNNQMTINFANQSFTPGNIGDVTLYNESNNYTERWAILLPGAATTVTASTTVSGYNVASGINVPAVTNNAYISGNEAVGVVMMADLPFSVGSNSTVHFSPGNLRATTSDLGSTWTWSFAAHQYDFVGDNPANNAVERINNIGPNNPIVTANGTVDLFAWSSDANNNFYGIASGGTSGYFYGNFVDWGIVANAASLGGHNDWRTLSKDEWNYLLTQRSNAASKWGRATIGDILGVIILPDAWTGPTLSSTGYNSSNTIQLSDWPTWESYGAVFLPAAGLRTFRSDMGVYITSVNGYYGNLYWTSTIFEISDQKAAYYMDFSYHYYSPHWVSSGNGYWSGAFNLYEGMSVRLVR